MTYETPTGANMFAYCMNNPVMGIDPDGEWSTAATVGVAAGIGIAAIALSVALVLASSIVSAPLLGAIAVGAAKALVGAAVGTVAGTAIGYSTTGTADGAAKGAALGFGGGTAVGAVAGGAAVGVNYAKTNGLIIKEVGRLNASNHANDPQLGIKYQINKPNGRPTIRSIEFHYNHKHNEYSPHWQQNSWNPRNNSVSSMKHWTWWGNRI